jgi:predicted permease
MQAILAVTIPFFALVLAGYLAAHRHVLPESAIPGLNAFVLYFALPCMLFRFGAMTPVLELLNPGAFAVWVVAALLIVFVTLAFSLNRRIGLKDAAFGALVGAFPNSGFMGLPLVAALMGPAATGAMVTTLLVDLFVTSSLCIALAQAAGAAHDHGAGARVALSRALRGAISNPLPWAIAAGAVTSAIGFKLTGPLDVIVRLLADAATPVALFTIGAVLFRAGQHVHGRTALVDYVPVALVKLLLHPLLVFALALAARSLGLPLSNTAVVVLTLTAALPSASSVSLLAERFGADTGRIARIIMTSTVLAFVTFSTLAWLFGVQQA